VRVAPARHVAAGGLQRNVAVPGNKTGKHLGFDVLHRGALGFGEAAHVVMGEADVVLQLLRHHLARPLAGFVGDDDIAVPLVEVARIGHGAVIAAAFELVEHVDDDVAHILLAGG
jgi:hypothetical protein